MQMSPYAMSVLCRIGEIEIMVASKEEAPAAAKKIDDIAKELGKERMPSFVLLISLQPVDYRAFQKAPHHSCCV